MNAPARLTAFAAVLAAAFGAAALAGAALDPDAPGGEQPRDHGAEPGMAAHGGGGGHTPAATAPRGLAVAQDGLRLTVATPTFARGRAATLRFRIVGADGRAIRRFAVTHTKRMHLIVVRRDLTGFQHLHPRMAADGTWSTPLRLRDAGTYRVFADFERPDGTPMTLASDLEVDGGATHRALPAQRSTAVSDGGYDVRVAGTTTRAGTPGTLRFTITKDGRPVETEPYLGAGGHLVALREGDLAFLHVHPEEHAGDGHGDAEPIAFETTLPTPGRYRLFLQFRHHGRIQTVAFTREAR